MPLSFTVPFLCLREDPCPLRAASPKLSSGRGSPTRSSAWRLRSSSLILRLLHTRLEPGSRRFFDTPSARLGIFKLSIFLFFVETASHEFRFK